MKKLLIGGIVGGIIIFIWQTLSWTVLDLHRSGQDYTPKQDTILNFLNSQFSEDGSYYMISTPKGTSNEEMSKRMEERMGKPWAQIQYHKELKVNMGTNIFRGLIVTILMVIFVVWILAKISPTTFAVTFVSTLLIGVIVFINSPYTMHIWYPKADIMAHMTDALVSWGLCGIWLGWYLNRKQ
jgi:hypothetical protein